MLGWGLVCLVLFMLGFFVFGIRWGIKIYLLNKYCGGGGEGRRRIVGFCF